MGGDVGCRVCGAADSETVEHFLQECDGRREVREVTGEEAATVRDLLLFGVGGRRGWTAMEDTLEDCGAEEQQF